MEKVLAIISFIAVFSAMLMSYIAVKGCANMDDEIRNLQFRVLILETKMEIYHK